MTSDERARLPKIRADAALAVVANAPTLRRVAGHATERGVIGGTTAVPDEGVVVSNGPARGTTKVPIQFGI